MNKCIKSMLLFVFLFSGFTFAQDSLNVAKKDSAKIANLEKRIKALEEKQNENDLEKLLNEAQTASNEKSKEKKTKVFKSGQRALQAINPEISVTGDAYGQFILNKDGFREGARTGAYFRTLGIHIQGNLDPFSLTKVAVEVHPDGVELGEAYVTWSNILPKISLTAGKFRQQFGVVNRWHVHSLDQFDFPLALTTILGEDGLNQIGLSFNWLMPSITADANNLIVEITNGQNDQLFGGEMFSFPSILMHLKNYYDLSRNAYLEFGLTAMYGRNNFKGFDNGIKVVEDTRNTILGGVDLTIFWEPVNQALYHSFLWRSELYYANKEVAPNQNIKALGGYSYIDYKLAEQWQIGTRFDYTQPFEVNNSSKYTYQVVPYITWWQSHWVRMRLQYSYMNGNVLPESANTLRLQMVWAVGPHKHDRY